jgi:hypothetical protein
MSDIAFQREGPAMKTRKHAFILTGLVAAVLLVPALIWSGRRTVDTATRSAAVKLPEVSTVGPEMTPYVLAPPERDKLRLPAYSPPSSFDFPYATPQPTIVTGEGPYTGMTPAELEKLAALRRGSSTANGGTAAEDPRGRGGRAGDEGE